MVLWTTKTASRPQKGIRNCLMSSSIFTASLSVLVLLSLLLHTLRQSKNPRTHFYTGADSQWPQFQNLNATKLREKFLWYAPHSGFNNQLSELKNAVLMAAILNRTLIVPPILDHHAIALGSCPKFRVTEPSDIRASVWSHITKLIETARYISIADIVDVAPLVPSYIRAVDFRTFFSTWCGVNFDATCHNAWKPDSSLAKELQHCGDMISGMFSKMMNRHIYTVNEDCRNTVWVYSNDGQRNNLDLFQPSDQLKRKRGVSYVRVRRDVHKTLGPGSAAQHATLLAFGSLFTAPYRSSELYIDIHQANFDHRIQSLIEELEFLHFVPEIMRAGKEYALTKIGAHFLCAQLRLLDGQFKYHHKATFLRLGQKLEALKQMLAQPPFHVFVMTDLPRHNWTGTYLEHLASDPNNFRIHFLGDEDELVIQTAREIARHGMRSVYLDGEANNMDLSCASSKSPQVLLYIEQTVCSCASLGFVGTPGSTISEHIELMRKHNMCTLKN